MRRRAFPGSVRGRSRRIPTASTRTRTSPGPGVGTGTSTSRASPGRSTRKARMERHYGAVATCGRRGGRPLRRAAASRGSRLSGAPNSQARRGSSRRRGSAPSGCSRRWRRAGRVGVVRARRVVRPVEVDDIASVTGRLGVHEASAIRLSPHGRIAEDQLQPSPGGREREYAQRPSLPGELELARRGIRLVVAKNVLDVRDRGASKGFNVATMRALSTTGNQRGPWKPTRMGDSGSRTRSASRSPLSCRWNSRRPTRIRSAGDAGVPGAACPAFFSATTDGDG